MANDRLYVIINDVSSLDIEGLYIEELPPISKPTMRSLREEIDGKDGDIVTKLGYSAYDKEMKIGLAQNYDINEVISFFNSKGKIQFSNELDKYYNFEILDQIDFESLQTFKNAVVTFHCQPFKYPVEEEPIEGEISPIVVNGSSHAIDTSADPIELNIYGNTLQYANPSISSPKEIYEAQKTTFFVTGKNIMPNIPSYANHRINSSTYRITEDENYDIYRFPIIGNKDYMLSITNPSNIDTEFAVRYFNFNNTVFDTHSYTIPANSTLVEHIELQEDIVKVECSYAKSSTNVQLEFGDTATDYQEYVSQEYEVYLKNYTNYNDLYINKIGSVYDSVFKNVPSSPFYDDSLILNEWYVNKRIKKISVPSGSTEISLSDIAYIPGFDNYISKYGGHRAGNIIRYDSALPSTDVLLYISAYPENIRIYQSETLDYIVNNISSYQDITNIMVYPRQLPVNFEAKIAMNNIINKTITNNGNIYSKPKLDIVGYGSINVSLNNNQIFSVNVEDEVVIDPTNLEAYNPNTKQLMNRQVVGNIDNLKLEPGENTLRFTGNITSVSITDYTRYL